MAKHSRTVETLIVDAVRDATGKFSVPTQAVQETAQVVINQTNNEPWFQSRVTLGSFGGILGALAVIANMFANGGVDVVELSGALATLIGAGVALYGRWAAKKPIGA